ncbi:hypothetical protein PUN28_013025 [Cardiocondyla obscurior]|uniref:Uncharacterized protein n=1 Tax=Cardiocondyla obscurior TaxID=286306 RepID=A0AAW2F6K8_9HYME
MRRVFCEILQYFEERFNYITMYRVYVQGDRPRILIVLTYRNQIFFCYSMEK